MEVGYEGTHTLALANTVPDKNILDAKKYPFHQALTTAQCIQYALDKPGVMTPDQSIGKCVYCKHCHPCLAGLDIGLIKKYYDLALQGILWQGIII